MCGAPPVRDPAPQGALRPLPRPSRHRYGGGLVSNSVRRNVGAKVKCRVPCQGTASQREVNPPGRCRSSLHVEPGREALAVSYRASLHAPACLPSDHEWHGTGWQLIPFAGVRRVPVSDLAPAPERVSAPLQAKFANELDPEFHQAPTASTSMIAGARLIAVRTHGNARQGCVPCQESGWGPATAPLAGRGRPKQVPRRGSALGGIAGDAAMISWGPPC